MGFVAVLPVPAVEVSVNVAVSVGDVEIGFVAVSLVPAVVVFEDVVVYHKHDGRQQHYL